MTEGTKVGCMVGNKVYSLEYAGNGKMGCEMCVACKVDADGDLERDVNLCQRLGDCGGVYGYWKETDGSDVALEDPVKLPDDRKPLSNVSELIRQLQELPQDAKVFAWNPEIGDKSIITGITHYQGVHGYAIELETD